MGKSRKHDAKGAQKDKEIEGDFRLPTLKTPGNRSTSPVPSSSSTNGLDFISQHVVKKGFGIEGKKLKLKTKREECRAKEALNCEAEIAMQ